MEFLGWMYDIAREQSPREDALAEALRRSGEAGYTAVGLYVEHRFAYPSALWAAAPGALLPDAVRRLSAGTNRLLCEGAMAVLEPRHLLEQLVAWGGEIVDAGHLRELDLAIEV
ncbi:MAG: hypothetical protein ACE5IM_09655, partial [Nitrospinota bacterium]